MRKVVRLFLPLIMLFLVVSCASIQNIKEKDNNFINGKNLYNEANQLFSSFDKQKAPDVNQIISMKSKFYKSDSNLYVFFLKYPNEEETISMLAKNYYCLAYIEVIIGDNLDEMEKNLNFSKEYYHKVPNKYNEMKGQLDEIQSEINNNRTMNNKRNELSEVVNIPKNTLTPWKVISCVIEQIPYLGVFYDVANIVYKYKSEVYGLIQRGFNKGEVIEFFNKKLKPELIQKGIKKLKNISVILSAIQFYQCIESE